MNVLLRPGGRFVRPSPSLFAVGLQNSRISTLNTVCALRLSRPTIQNAGSRWGTHRVGLGLATSISLAGIGALELGKGKVFCDPSPAKTPPETANPTVVPPASPNEPLPPPPQSSLDMYQLTFGTVAGVCAGVFVKKGVKTLAFILGGVFVLLQYFNSLSVISINWTHLESRFQKMFYSPPTEPGGKPGPPTLYSLWNWLVDFLTADFQQRASFIAGLALGLRIG